MELSESRQSDNSGKCSTFLRIPAGISGMVDSQEFPVIPVREFPVALVAIEA